MSFEVSGQDAQKVVELMMKGDDRCPLKLGWRVEKLFADGPEDRHALGSQGTVIGSIYNEEFSIAAYLVEFDSDGGIPTFVTGIKINKI